ncbi:hypothetical protein, partial [Streptomyces sp. NPDC047108]|uniref:hypothetical protein n=1 Tax=Streptomyces sp. NPDC047108 TaxID=3155025 RepID=UPI0033CA3A90
MTSEDRTRELTLLPPAQLDALAADRELIANLRAQLPPADFADTAAQLLVRVPEGVEQPVSARAEVQRRIAGMLADPEVAERLVSRGVRMIVVPRDAPLTSLGPFAALSGADAGGRAIETVRGLNHNRQVAVTEENLLGETTVVPGDGVHPDGYSTTTHEIAHAIHESGLSTADRALIESAYRARVAEGTAAHWPDGPLLDPSGVRPGPNYSSRDKYEYFAQLTNAYLGTNTGTDPYTGAPRNNGVNWVRQHEPGLLPLLERLYGPPQETGDRANPFVAVQEENETWTAFRELWDRAEEELQSPPFVPSPSVDEAPQGLRFAPPTNPAVELVAAFEALKGSFASSGPARAVPVVSSSSESGMRSGAGRSTGVSVAGPSSAASSAGLSSGVPGGVESSEFRTWQRMFTPGVSAEEQQRLRERIAVLRGGVVPSDLEVDLRRSVRDGLAALPGVTVVVDDAANYGHQAAATMLMDSLSELGYPGRITVVAPGSVQERLRLLVPESMRERVDWHTGEFGSGSSGPGVRGVGAEGSLVLVAASDRLDGDPDTAREFLDFVGADQAVVLKPYAWGESSRMVYSRAGAGAPVTVHALEGEAGSGLIPRGRALYRFGVPKLSGPELDVLIAEQVGGVRGEGLRAVADAVRDGRVDVMPVYGLHNVDAPGRASAVGTLASGLHGAGLGKPSVVITFGDAMVPFAPRHRAEWLGYAGLGDADLGERIAALGPDEVLVVDGGKLRQDVFRQVYQLGSLPAVLEGANTSNLVQLLGRPFFSVLTNHTPYDPLVPEGHGVGPDGGKVPAKELQGVTDAIVQETEWGARLQGAPEWEQLQRARTARSVLGDLPEQDGGRLLTQDEMQR